MAPTGRAVRVVERCCLGVAAALAVAGLVSLIGFAAATVLDGLLRSLADMPLVSVGDVGPFLVAAAVAACFPLAQLQRANITIDFLGPLPGGVRARIVRGLCALLVTIVLGAMTRQMFVYAMNSAAGGDSTVMLEIPTAPFWYATAVMLACATLCQLFVVFQVITGRRGPEAAVH